MTSLVAPPAEMETPVLLPTLDGEAAAATAAKAGTGPTTAPQDAIPRASPPAEAAGPGAVPAPASGSDYPASLVSSVTGAGNLTAPAAPVGAAAPGVMPPNAGVQWGAQQQAQMQAQMQAQALAQAQAQVQAQQVQAQQAQMAGGAPLMPHQGLVDMTGLGMPGPPLGVGALNGLPAPALLGRPDEPYRLGPRAEGVEEDDFGMGAIKLFVGQIPKDIEEEQLRPIFEEYGEIFELAVIRDRHTGAHRGCAFLTYKTKESGDMAIRELHNRLVLPKAHNPLQVKPAAGRAERENKLFVGMMPRSATDADVGAVFGRFGDIREIYIIRDTDGSSKGCAFLKFKLRTSALAAIRELNDKYTMEGAPRPLIVKFADNKRPQRKRDERMGLQPAYPQPYAQLALAPQFFAAAPGGNPTALIPINVGGAGAKVLGGGVGAPLMYYQPVVAPTALSAGQDGAPVQYIPYHPHLQQPVAIGAHGGHRYQKPGAPESHPQHQGLYPYPMHGQPQPGQLQNIGQHPDSVLGNLEASFGKVNLEDRNPKGPQNGGNPLGGPMPENFGLNPSSAGGWGLPGPSSTAGVNVQGLGMGLQPGSAAGPNPQPPAQNPPGPAYDVQW